MRFFKTEILATGMVILAMFLLTCNSTKESKRINAHTTTFSFQENPSFILDKSYYQYWANTNSSLGVHLYISVLSNKNKVLFDSVYFRGMHSKLRLGKMGYIASFNMEHKKPKDWIMSGEKNAEYGNSIPKKNNSPFLLKDNECVLIYKENNTTKYYKIKNLIEKAQE